MLHKRKGRSRKAIYPSASTMEFSPLMLAFCVAVLTLLPHCSSDQVNSHDTVRQYDSAVHQSQFSLPLLPRKLKLQEEKPVKSSVGKNIEPHGKMMEAPSGSKRENVKQQKLPAGKGTWREWVEEGPNRSEYFTMDYVWLKRRRPIHNKQIPFVP